MQNAHHKFSGKQKKQGRSGEVLQLVGPESAAGVHHNVSVIRSFVIWVIAPVFLGIIFLTAFAQRHVTTQFGLVVTQNQPNQLGSDGNIFTGVFGSQMSLEAAIIRDHIIGPNIVSDLFSNSDTNARFSQSWPYDPIFSLSSNATLNQQHRFWNRITSVTLDPRTNLISVKTRAPTAELSRFFADTIISKSQDLIENMNQSAHDDTTRLARQQVIETDHRLALAEDAIANFKTDTGITDPLTEYQNKLATITLLEQQLTDALISQNQLKHVTRSPSERVAQSNVQVQTIRQQLSEQKSQLSQSAVGPNGETFPLLVSQFERLQTDLEFARDSHTLALMQMDNAVSISQMKARYVTVFSPPIQSKNSDFPNSFHIIFVLFTALFLTWATVRIFRTALLSS